MNTKSKKVIWGILSIVMTVIVVFSILWLKGISEYNLEKSLFSEKSIAPITQNSVQEAVLGESNTKYYWEQVKKDPLTSWQQKIYGGKDSCTSKNKAEEKECEKEKALLALQKNSKKDPTLCNTIEEDGERIQCQEYTYQENALLEKDIFLCEKIQTEEKSELCKKEVIKQDFFLSMNSAPTQCTLSRDPEISRLCEEVRKENEEMLQIAKIQRNNTYNMMQEIISSGEFHRCITLNPNFGAQTYCQIKILEKEVTEKRITKTEACSILDNTTPLPILTNTDTYTVETLPLREACEKLIKE